MANEYRFPTNEYLNSLPQYEQRELLANLINTYNKEAPSDEQLAEYNPTTPDLFRQDFNLMSLFGENPYQREIGQVANRLFTNRGVYYPILDGGY